MALLLLKRNKALDENSSLSYGVSPAVWDHIVLSPDSVHSDFGALKIIYLLTDLPPDTVTHLAVTPANKLVLRFTYPGEMEG